MSDADGVTSSSKQNVGLMCNRKPDGFKVFLFGLVAVLVIATLVGFAVIYGKAAEAGEKCSRSATPHCGAIAREIEVKYASLMASLRSGPKLPTRVGNCRKVDVWSFSAMAECRRLKAECKAAGWIGNCASMCAKCDAQRKFILGWETFCLKNGYTPVATRRRPGT